MRFTSMLMAVGILATAGAMPRVVTTRVPPVRAQVAMPLVPPPSASCDPRQGIGALPFRVTRPGSYYLTANLKGIAGRSGIVVLCDDVTIDMAGFTITGVPGSKAGIVAPNSQTNVVVRNGSIRSWGEEGVDLGLVGFCRLEGLHAIDNGLDGIRCGTESQLRGCMAGGNGKVAVGDGFDSRGHAIFDSCLSSGNSGCGLRTGEDSSIEGCTANHNGEDGFDLGEGSVVRGSSARKNLGCGIQASGSVCQISDCAVSRNSLHGIDAGDGSSVVHCTIVGNEGFGLLLNQRVLVAECNVSLNQGHGIEALANCFLLANLCSNNQGSGINLRGPRSRIERNTCLENGEHGITDKSTSGAVDQLLLSNYGVDNVDQDFRFDNDNNFGRIESDPGAGFDNDNPWANVHD